MVFNLSLQKSIGNHFLAELRSVSTQQDRMRFRKNLERLGELMAYEISKKLEYEPHTIQTPLGHAPIDLLTQQPVLVTILRAGFPFFQGFLNFFDQADCGFIGAYRTEGEDAIAINLDYAATPPVAGRTLILVDPMLATGRSVVDSLKVILKHGTPRHVCFAAVICAPEGVAYIHQNVSIPHSIYTGAIDEKLDHRFYIVPGLGDAGDLSYGAKL
jgi:uracil phosphoribosyltransferase